MIRNMRMADRLARIVVAGVAVWPALVVGPGTAGGVVILVIAGVFTATSLTGFCPIYLAAGRVARATRHAA